MLKLEVLNKIYIFVALRKIVRNQSKMVHTPFSETRQTTWKNHSQILMNSQSNGLLFPDFSGGKVVHRTHGPVVAPTRIPETSRGPPLKPKVTNDIIENELRLTRTTLHNISFPELWNRSTFFDDAMKTNDSSEEISQSFGQIQLPPAQQYFPHLINRPIQFGPVNISKEKTIVIPPDHVVPHVAPGNSTQYKGVYTHPKIEDVPPIQPKMYTEPDAHQDIREKADFFIEEMSADRSSIYSYNMSDSSYTCTKIHETKTDIDVQERFLSMEIEVSYVKPLLSLIFVQSRRK